MRAYLTFIWYTYPFNFLVFMILMIVKHRHRRVAIDVPQKRLDALHSASESDSGDKPELKGPDIETYFREANTGLLKDEQGELPAFYNEAVEESNKPVQISVSNTSRSPPRRVSADSLYGNQDTRSGARQQL